MELYFLRHATMILQAGDVRLLIDPMLSPKEALDPVPNCKNVARIPMVELPISEEALMQEIKSIDAVVVTHMHRDHWDAKAQQIIPKETPIICQPTDADKIKEQGFTHVLPVDGTADFKKLRLYRTGGQHGTGEIGMKMGHVSGFVIAYNGQKIYVAGDTIWCGDVEQALREHRPDCIVLNAGAAQFDQGDPITMTAADVITTIEQAGSSKIIAVHMDTVNHCWLKRTDLVRALSDKNLAGRCNVPRDGERLML